MSGILFATDLDKTLLDDEARVPPICVDAIRSYVQKGGLFTIATGRPTRGALLYPEIIDLVNAPIITYNGACIYDTRKKGPFGGDCCQTHLRPCSEPHWSNFQK